MRAGLALGVPPRLVELPVPDQAAAFENARDAGFGDADLDRDVLLGAVLTASAVVREIWLGDEWVFRSGHGNHPPPLREELSGDGRSDQAAEPSE
jgi:hypothetical protein